jgi:hypothetical protein
MPPWSLKELKQCNSAIYHLPENEIDEVYSYWGGNARFVFRNEPIDKSIKIWNDMISSLSSNEMGKKIRIFHQFTLFTDAMLLSVGNPVDTKDRSIRDSIQHIYPENMSVAKRIWASPKVLDALLDKRLDLIKIGFIFIINSPHTCKYKHFLFFRPLLFVRIPC